MYKRQIATNHSAYDDVVPKLPPSALLVDPWNASGSGQVFAFADELARVSREGEQAGGAEREWERLIAEGRVTPGVGDLLDVEPLPADPKASKTLSQLLREDRDAHDR